MSESCCTKSDLVNAVYWQLKGQNPSVHEADARLAVEAVFETIRAALMLKRKVKVQDFGSFKPDMTAPRTIPHIQTGEKIFLHSRRTVRWRPAPSLKEALNG